MTVSNTHVIWFADPEGVDLSLVGGKGANLGRMTQKGFVVPPGFVVGTTAYMAHIDTLKAQIATMLARINYADANALDEAVAQIRRLITGTEVPPSVASEIVSCYHKLGSDLYVAVRSSGTAEDLDGASFAGLHDTYLDIRGDAAVIDAVKRCWASLWTARAVSYRKTQGFNAFPSIAIVVQQMVESEVSGVMFTGNPINTATDELMINASWGLGEAVVSGIVNDPASCGWQPSALQCTGAKTDTCLTAPQVTALQAVYDGTRASDGSWSMLPMRRGGEAGWGFFVGTNGSGQDPTGGGGLAARICTLSMNTPVP